MIMPGTTIIAALRLPSDVLHSLESGDISVIHARNKPNQDFCLCSNDSDASQVKISAWARCEGSQQFSEKNKCDILAAHLQISTESLQNALERDGFIWLTYLRVYHLPSPIIIKNSTKGVFIALENRIYIDKLQPVLDDRNFEIQKERLLKLEPPESLLEKIERTLNEATAQRKVELKDKLNWINTIVSLGDRSIEQEEKKNNWQAGTDFENITKQSLEFLGFTIDQSYKGGAGGLDLFCSKPYPLTGECKAGKSIPSGTTEELIKLGGMRLGRERFINSTKLIIGAGNPTPDVIAAAFEWKVSIIKAMTLQKLVQLKAKYDGAINLFELKGYLESGQIDAKIAEYIDKVENGIKLRSHMITAVRELQEQNNERPGVSEIRTQFNARFSQNLSTIIDRPMTNEILIELSSPLAGYLGREKDDRGSDRFYYLRDLPIENEKHI
jgi:Domain of unknown function (DUF1802)